MDKIGSVKVPMDSWVYGALERVAALGLIPSQELGIRPWTRSECLRQVSEAEEAVSEEAFGDGILDEANRLLTDLRHEFSDTPDADTAAVDSIYSRAGIIAGPALTQSFTIGQTWWNDYGRPLNRGTSGLAGISARATRGRFFFGLREEAQRDPGNAAVSQAEASLLSFLLILPPGVPLVMPMSGTPAHMRYRPLALYAGVAFAGQQLSFGKQELYWGPGVMGPLSFSSNAEPTYNLQLASVRPLRLPLVPRLGTYSYDLVFGKLSGHILPARPYFNGIKVNFVLGETLEVGFTRWSLLWGAGHPITLGSLKRNLFSSNSTGSGAYGDRLDPGDRKSDFDFVLHLPGLRKYFTLYADAYSDDEVSPIDAPRRVAWNPGIYFPQLPFLPHNDLRVEAVSTEELSQDEGGGRFFTNNNYVDANQNKGFLLGTAAGRDARSIEARTGYWFSGKSHLELGYRQTYQATQYIPRAGTIQDFFGRASYAFNREWSMQVFSQWERFLIPAYMAGAHHNGSARFQITWTPVLAISTKNLRQTAGHP